MSPVLDLKNIVNLCRSEESAVQDSSALKGKVPIQRYSLSTTRMCMHPNSKKNIHAMQETGHKKKLKCPTLDKSCAKCGKTGDFGEMCKSKTSYNNNGKYVSNNGKIYYHRMKISNQ